MIRHESIRTSMRRKAHCKLASLATLPFATLAHCRSKRVRYEPKKCPRFRSAWTLCKANIRYWQNGVFLQPCTLGGRQFFSLVAPNKTEVAEPRAALLSCGR